MAENGSAKWQIAFWVVTGFTVIVASMSVSGFLFLTEQNDKSYKTAINLAIESQQRDELINAARAKGRNEIDTSILDLRKEFNTAQCQILQRLSSIETKIEMLAKKVS